MRDCERAAQEGDQLKRSSVEFQDLVSVVSQGVPFLTNDGDGGFRDVLLPE